MSSIVILSECAFTRAGLAALLTPAHAVTRTSDPQTCLARLSQRTPVSLVILCVSSRQNLDALVRLVLRIRHCQPRCKLLLDLGAISLPLVRYYFNFLHGQVGVIDLAQPVSALRRFIEQVVNGHVTLSAEAIAGPSCLNERECSVLRRVILGVNPTDIARTLTLSVKTVSHYKCTGLFKLGARNLQTLLSPAPPRQLTPRARGLTASSPSPQWRDAEAPGAAARG